MRQYDLAPLYRSSVGFDRLFSLIDQLGAFEQPNTAYPPYNIEKTGENAYRISVAVAGFSADELSVEMKENGLTVSGRKAEASTERTWSLRRPTVSTSAAMKISRFCFWRG